MPFLRPSFRKGKKSPSNGRLPFTVDCQPLARWMKLPSLAQTNQDSLSFPKSSDHLVSEKPSAFLGNEEGEDDCLNSSQQCLAHLMVKIYLNKFAPYCEEQKCFKWNMFPYIPPTLPAQFCSAILLSSISLYLELLVGDITDLFWISLCLTLGLPSKQMCLWLSNDIMQMMIKIIEKSR